MALIVAFAVASACGGRAATDGDAGGSGAVGAAGAAGAPSAQSCSLPQAPGSCRGYEPSFWHDPKTGLCEPFTYGGCDGNANRFSSQAECAAACPGGGSDWGACERDVDCEVVTAGCCQACEPISGEQLYAANTAHTGDEHLAQCPEEAPCLPCTSDPDAESTGKYFRATCESGQCVVRDVRNSPITACETAANCELRAGLACCPNCAAEFIAVNGSTNFCPDGQEPCGLCLALSPEGFGVDCVDRHCVVTRE